MEEACERLRGCFETTDWDVLCSSHGEDTDGLTQRITDYISFCVESTVPSKKIWGVSDNKPWVTPELQALLNEKKMPFSSGDKDNLERIQKELKCKLGRTRTATGGNWNINWSKTTIGSSGQD